jgi:hypothetical protein
MFIYRLNFILVLFFLLTGCDFSSKTDAQILKHAICAPNTMCNVPNGIKIWLSSPKLSPETPFSIFVDLPTHLKITQSKLEGITMYMGFIPQQFEKKKGVWQSDTMVGICSEKNMLWKLEIILKNEITGAVETVNYFFYVNY